MNLLSNTYNLSSASSGNGDSILITAMTYSHLVAMKYHNGGKQCKLADWCYGGVMRETLPMCLLKLHTKMHHCFSLLLYTPCEGKVFLLSR
ncbi:hypothetical protein Hamer_G012202 [Homarus americanus]|uniref:Uncharacterized protein n=1 Tax=Homarus americanus TaxID=6706 RepID=A0A8J5N097_HOMAM|nr:hypothetical protein Hamer_G012202 [Homarus americanus]